MQLSTVEPDHSPGRGPHQSSQIRSVPEARGNTSSGAGDTMPSTPPGCVALPELKSSHMPRVYALAPPSVHGSLVLIPHLFSWPHHDYGFCLFIARQSFIRAVGEKREGGIHVSWVSPYSPPAPRFDSYHGAKAERRRSITRSLSRTRTRTRPFISAFTRRNRVRKKISREANHGTSALPLLANQLGVR